MGNGHIVHGARKYYKTKYSNYPNILYHDHDCYPQETMAHRAIYVLTYHAVDIQLKHPNDSQHEIIINKKIFITLLSLLTQQ